MVHVYRASRSVLSLLLVASVAMGWPTVSRAEQPPAYVTDLAGALTESGYRSVTWERSIFSEDKIVADGPGHVLELLFPRGQAQFESARLIVDVNLDGIFSGTEIRDAYHFVAVDLGMSDVLSVVRHHLDNMSRASVSREARPAHFQVEEASEPEALSAGAAPSAGDDAAASHVADYVGAQSVGGALDLGALSVIGIVGSPSDMRALVRLPSGTITTIRGGDSVRGLRVIAIAEGGVTFARRGDTLTLTVPN